MSRINLTGVHDTDRKILFYLDDEDLFRACSASHYTRELCDNQFWFQKFFNTYHANLNRYGFSGDDYKNLYQKLRKMDNNSIFFYAAKNGYLELVESMLDNFKVNIHAKYDAALRLAARYD